MKVAALVTLIAGGILSVLCAIIGWCYTVVYQTWDYAFPAIIFTAFAVVFLTGAKLVDKNL